ncbi:PTS sugar transporter subunit IIA [Clostridium sp. UBA1652]|uniref:PTS sugar transporter subunit IIA n=1 Tax=Clostridium sp. UBA1652 TaxID=1946348 RepID=UPI00257D0A7F|nr:PTS sugar transporter subunit IIA [Clostridium sp. UBA1652]
MIPVIIAAHGRLAEELVNSAEMIFGKQENIQKITFLPGENTEDLKKKYNEKIEGLKNYEEILILVDLFGGSPYNAAFEIAMINDKLEILTGVSLPMLLEILSIRDGINLIKEINESIKNSKNEYIRSFKELNEAIYEEELI